MGPLFGPPPPPGFKKGVSAVFFLFGIGLVGLINVSKNEPKIYIYIFVKILNKYMSMRYSPIVFTIPHNKSVTIENLNLDRS